MNSPDLKTVAFGDLDRELAVTRTVLERLPEQHYDWKPHDKSMSLGQLAAHVATLPGWASAAIDKDELDAATAPRPPEYLKNRTELLALFDKNEAALHAAISRFDMANFDKPWTMRNGEQIIVTKARSFVFRIWSINHLIHHRGQLCLYLRLLNVPVPTVYFNTADDQTWVFD